MDYDYNTEELSFDLNETWSATVNVNTTPKVVPNDGQPGRFIGADDFVNVDSWTVFAVDRCRKFSGNYTECTARSRVCQWKSSTDICTMKDSGVELNDIYREQMDWTIGRISSMYGIYRRFSQLLSDSSSAPEKKRAGQSSHPATAKHLRLTQQAWVAMQRKSPVRNFLKVPQETMVLNGLL